MQVEELIEKIKSLPPERIAEVEDCVDFIARRDDRQLVQAAAKKLFEKPRQGRNVCRLSDSIFG